MLLHDRSIALLMNRLEPENSPSSSLAGVVTGRLVTRPVTNSPLLEPGGGRIQVVLDNRLSEDLF